MIKYLIRIYSGKVDKIYRINKILQEKDNKVYPKNKV
jgi:hypothetical protein